MANEKISDMSAATTPLDGTELVPLVQGGDNVKTAVSNLTAGRSVDGTSFVVTGSTVPANGVYLPSANRVGIAANTLLAAAFNVAGAGGNYFRFQGSASAPTLLVEGASTNIALQVFTKGTGGFDFYTDAGNASAFQILHVASSANNLTVSGSTGTNPVVLGTAGSGNIDILLSPLGSGVLRFGAHSGVAAETITGYITIKDAAGNSRKLAVIS